MNFSSQYFVDSAKKRIEHDLRCYMTGTPMVLERVYSQCVCAPTNIILLNDILG